MMGLLRIWHLIALTALLALHFPATTSRGDEAGEGPRSATRIVVQGGTVHPVSGPEIAGGALVVEGGRIVFVGPQVPEGLVADQTIDATGQHVYPSLLDADTAIGLVEIEAVRATVDLAEVGLLNPNAKATTAFNPDSELIPVARSEGVLLAHAVPRGSFVLGISAVMQLDGWNVSDMALSPRTGLHVAWPPATYIPAWNVDPSLREVVKKRQERIQELASALDDARDTAVRAENSSLISGDESRPQDNLRLEAFRSVVQGELPLMVHVDELRAMQESVAFAQSHKLKLVIVGGYDAPLCAALLKDFDVPVIVAGTQRLPLRRDSVIDEPFTVPRRLQEAGVRYCLAGFDRFSASAIRNLPHHAGTAVAHGLSREHALRAITLSPAEILGVAHRVGSLEPGKDATFFLADGDILEVPTHVTRAFLQGREIDLDNRHKRLWRKYRDKGARK